MFSQSFFAIIATSLVAGLAHATDPATEPVQVLVKSQSKTCTATVVQGRRSLQDLIPGTVVTYKDTALVEDVTFQRFCEVRVPKQAFMDRFGFCAVAGGNGCWISTHEHGGRMVYLSAGGPETVEACMYTCTGSK